MLVQSHINMLVFVSTRYLKHIRCITCPTGSNPRLPARPAICVYSCGVDSVLNHQILRDVNTQF